MYFRLIALIFLLGGCHKSNFTQIDVVGHAGNGLEIQNSMYHANSLEAINLALGLAGCNGVEVDVQLSKDGELWLLHDEHLDTETNGSGCIAESNDEYLKTINYQTVNKEKLTKFSDLNFDLYTGKTLYLDLRHYNFCANQVIDVQEILSKLSNYENKLDAIELILCTKRKEWIEPISNAGWLVFFEVNSFAEFSNLMNETQSFDGILIRSKSITKNEVKQVISANKKVTLFGIRSPKSIREAFEKHPNTLIVDDLKAALIEKSH